MATLQTAPTRRRHTELLPIPYFKREGGMRKAKVQTGTPKASYCNNTCEVLQEKATAYVSQEVPLLEAYGHPKHSWGKLLTSIASSLTSP